MCPVSKKHCVSKSKSKSCGCCDALCFLSSGIVKTIDSNDGVNKEKITFVLGKKNIMYII